MESLQKDIHLLTKEFHELMKCPKAPKKQMINNQNKQRNYDKQKNRKTFSPMRHSTPFLIPSPTQDDDWRTIEIFNIVKLLSDGKLKKFFRLVVDYYDVKSSLKNNGILAIRHDLHRSISIIHQSGVVDKYLLLQEKSVKPLDYTGTMIGVAAIMDENLCNNNTRNNKENIRVLYLSLSRSNLDLSGVAMGEVKKIEDFLWKHVDLLKKKMVLPFISEIYPWCKNFSLPSTSSPNLDENMNEQLSPAKLKEIEKGIPALTNPKNTHLKNGSNIEVWRTTEHNNLEDITDWAGSQYYFADINIGILYESLVQGTYIEVDELLYEDIDFSSDKSTYLIIRKVSMGDMDSAMKPIVGIAQVLEKDIDYRLKCVFLSLSCPQYVGSPWNDAGMFVNGQKIEHKEDVRIILDEYKLSLRHKKAEPLFEDLFPWCPTADPDPSSPKKPSSAVNKTSVTLHFNFSNETENDNILEEEKPKLDSDRKQGTGRKLFSQTPSPQRCKQVKPTSPRADEKPPQKSFTSPRRKKNPPPWENDLENLELPSATMSCKSHPPLSNLMDRNRTLSTCPWNEIESQNIASILEAKQIEIFLCDTTIKQLLQSFRDEKLEISQKNMENIASSSRTKKCLILRIATPPGMKYVVGVAVVRTSFEVTVSNTASDRFLVAVNYSSLSCPLLNNLSARNHYDGMELYPNVANNFLQQYKFLLSKNKVKPLFTNIFPWNGISPQKGHSNDRQQNSILVNKKKRQKSSWDEKETAQQSNGGVVNGNEEKVESNHPKPILLDMDDFSSYRESGMLNCYFDDNVGDDSTSGLSFAEIQKDLDLQSIRSRPVINDYVQAKIAKPYYPSTEYVRREEAQRNWSRNLFRQINSQVGNNSGYKENPSKSNIGIARPYAGRGRGRGRGRLLEKQALQGKS